MPIPTRPVDGAEIATEWGQYVHDYSFAPAGAEVHGNYVTMAAAGANTILPLDIPDDDPGGYLDAVNDRIEVPTDGGGLYLIGIALDFVDGGASTEAVGEMLLNGTLDVRVGTAESLGATNSPMGTTIVRRLVAGDIMQLRARQPGGGTLGDVRVHSLFVLRLGEEFGAPTS